MRTRTPSRVSQSASTRPVGPAPTMRTGRAPAGDMILADTAYCIIRAMFIVGIDVGGTFTDLTAVDEATGRVVVTKVPSQPRHEAGAVLAGLDALDIAARDVRRLVHGTPVGTNTVLERP